MKRRFVIDASLNGTGIRDYYQSYLNPIDLRLDNVIIQRLEVWLLAYAEEHYNGYSNIGNIKILDKEGLDIALEIKKQVDQNDDVEYFSDANLTRTFIPNT